MMTMAELSKVIDRLEVHHLSVMAGVLKSRLVDEDVVVVGMALEVLRFFFGDTWTNENVLSIHSPISKASGPGREFLRTNSPDAENQFRWQSRVLLLAEAVFNLQHVGGMRERLRLVGRANLESIFGELQGAAIMAAPQLQFRFVTPSGIKGDDYDGEFQTATGETVCCEMKTKMERTDLSETTIRQSLKKACGQLPKNRPGVVFVWLPEDWLENDADLRKACDTAVESAFASQRAVAVVLLWPRLQIVDGGCASHMVAFRPYFNDRSALLTEAVREAISAMGRVKNSSWVPFRDFA